MDDDFCSTQDMLTKKRFWREVDEGIRLANREVIHQHLPELTKDDILALAVAVADLRSDYLAAGLRLTKGGKAHPPEQAVRELSEKRTVYQEALAAFDALREAVERGYVHVQGYPHC